MDFYRLIGPLLRQLPPESAHRATIAALKLGLGPRQSGCDDPILHSRVWGREFPNPVGLAAGFDKHAEVVKAALALGFGFVEVGTVTPKPQPGNPRPRVFRLAEDEAVINRLGFNSAGAAIVGSRLKHRRGITGVNIGRNRDSADAAADYAAALGALGDSADYVVVNVSSPNTPALRDLQQREPLRALIKTVLAARAALKAPGGPPPLLLKIAPDLGPGQLEEIAAVAIETGIDGIVATNTTLARPLSLQSGNRREQGGLSGAPLFAPSTEVLRALYRATRGRIPLIGVGGIRSGADAYAKIKAGATLVQLYTALVYRGPALIPRIKSELASCLKRDGFNGLAQAVGIEAR